ncbi:hypothetical protein [Aquifex aeolicus]|uniref:Uncharacterized protein aq_aa17 n=1 Tax=Aquifex aeolicus (strain VF5) TaxID=224324 RepID=YZ17_AQUAE|nr:hypothetical protein [Aquifex aeolicus]O66408.1 RecName: Full=Uncharacterized protein aq_aa17 [Aquifex aeolicus VF5]AAC07960.1 putative protein [Aquifex aeolicus VF5]
MRREILSRTLLLSSLFVAGGFLTACGGGGGGTGGGEQGKITNELQAKAALGNSLSAIRSSAGLTEDTQTGVGAASVGNKGGWLRDALKLYKSAAPQTGTLASQQQYTCDNGGTATIDYSYDSNTRTASATITFDNCGNTCSLNKYVIFNGTMRFSGKDINQNYILESGSISVDSGFSYTDQCENEGVYFEGNFSISVKGYIPNTGDIEDGNNNYKADLTLDGGPVKVTDGSKWERGSFDNLTFYINEYYPASADYEWKVNGGFRYQDSYCVTDPVYLSFNTTNIFKGYNTVECEYTGRLSVNNDLIVAESYDPDSKPSETENYLKILFNGNVVFDNLCTNFNPPDTCS